MGVVLTMASARAIVSGEGEWPEDTKGFASESTVRGAIYCLVSVPANQSLEGLLRKGKRPRAIRHAHVQVSR
jgi:hypothetical protein